MLVEEAGVQDAVDAEAAEILAQLALGAGRADIDVIGIAIGQIVRCVRRPLLSQ